MRAVVSIRSLVLLAGWACVGCGCPDEPGWGGGGPFPPPGPLPNPVVTLLPVSGAGLGQRLSPDLSADGTQLLFNLIGGTVNPNGDVFRLIFQSGALRQVNQDNSNSQVPGGAFRGRGSSDFQRVAFHSLASTLVAGDTNGESDVFLKDLGTSQISRLSVSTGGDQGNGFSGFAAMARNGDVVAFESDATNLVAGDTNGSRDVFVRDTVSNETRLVSCDSLGVIGDGPSSHCVISGDGSQVAFFSEATNLVAGDTNGFRDLFLKDMGTQAVTLISLGLGGAPADNNSASILPNDDVSMTPDARFIAFSSLAGNLVTGDTNQTSDVFVRDTLNNTTRRVSVSSSGAQSDGVSIGPVISDDGRFVVFQSTARNLDGNDALDLMDIFVVNTVTGQCRRVSRSMFGDDPDDACFSPRISGDGRRIVFCSRATNLVPEANQGQTELYLVENPLF